MEVLENTEAKEQQEQWLKPLLAGEIRSVFCMTEPAVASSDATNMEATATIEGDEIVLNGRKWWSTNLGHLTAKWAFYGVTDASAPSTNSIPWCSFHSMPGRNHRAHAARI